MSEAGSIDTEENDDTNESEQASTIGNVIDNFLHRVLDIEDCADNYIPSAVDKYNKNAEELKSTLTEYQKILDNEKNRDKKLVGFKHVRKAIREIDRHNNSAPVEILEKSLFIHLFSAFDKYIGDLISVLYQTNPRLYKNLNREISLSDALKFSSMDELKQDVLDKEIETIRRKSYLEQFKDLENKFSITLTKFDSWPQFIECSQRRNLFTHCDGIISKQYISTCKEAGFKFENKPLVGTQLEIGCEYFYTSCLLISTVAVMLGQTLWRKTKPEEIDNADSHLNSLVFDFLHLENWPKGILLSKFALSLPKVSSEEMERIFTINYAIALEGIDKPKAVKTILDKKDWSATSYDFKIAYAVLTNNYNEACEIMKKMGEEGELIDEVAYLDWPLFRNFRNSQDFLDGYESVYGYKYSEKLSSIAEEKVLEVTENAVSRIP